MTSGLVVPDSQKIHGRDDEGGRRGALDRLPTGIWDTLFRAEQPR